MKGEFSAAVALEQAKSIVAGFVIRERGALSPVRAKEARRHTMLATVVSALDEDRLEVRNAETGASHVLFAQPRIVRALLRTTQTVGLVVEENVVVGFIYY
ncbi:MAG: hypothetical protein ACLPYS_05050 [Vulcanimicrobiaceae bacterium]